MRGKIYFVFLAVLSAVLIFYKFNGIPHNLAFDEVDFAKLALSLDHQGYTPYSPLATGHSTLYFYLILLSFKLFGVTNLGLRLPAAIFGIGSILAFYFLLKTIFKKEHLALIGSLILLTSHWFINFPRFGFEATFLLFLELVSLTYLFRFLNSKKRPALLISALFSGLAFHSYYPGKIFILVPLLALLFDKKNRDALIYFFSWLLIASPLVIHYLVH